MSRRKPRFKAKPGPEQIRLTNRDLDILYQVWKFRFLRSDQVTRVVKGSEQGIKRRLGLLFHHGFLIRPSAQKRFYETELNIPLVYGVSRKGQSMLAEEGYIGGDVLTKPSENPGGLFLRHTLAVADFVIQFEKECKRNQRILSQRELFTEDDIRGNHPVGYFRWEVERKDQGQWRRLTVIPDALIGVEENGDRSKRIVYLVEIDCGTMPIRRRNLNQTSLLRKLIAYHETWRQRILTEKFGWRRWRVLIVMKSETRRESVFLEAKEITKGVGRGIFVFRCGNRRRDCRPTRSSRVLW